MARDLQNSRWIRTERMKTNHKRLYLHIGTEKTGTTSIQKFLKINRVLLAKHGIGIPESLGAEMHYYLQLMANNDDYIDSFTMNMELSNDQKDRKDLKSAWERAFAQEVKESAHKIWIISCETLHSRLRKKEEIKRLKRILKEIFAEINIVVYLRDPLSMYISRMTEQAKAAIKVELPDPVSLNREFDICDHRTTIKRWKGSMGQGKMIIRLFEKNSLTNNSVIDDFIDACDLPRCDYQHPKPQNRSLSKAGLMLLNEVNRYVPRRWLNRKIIPSRALLTRYFQKTMQKGQRFKPSEDDIKIYDTYYKSSNEWVRKRYYPDREQLFNTRQPSEEATNKNKYDQQDIEQVAILIANIWLTKNAQINYYKECYETLRKVCQSKGVNVPKLGAEKTEWKKYIER